MKKTTVPIKGMHCHSCELLVEDELTQIPGVSKVNVSERKACAEIYYDTDSLNVAQIDEAVGKAGYAIGYNEQKPLISKNIADYADIFYAGVALFFLYTALNILGITKSFGLVTGQPSSLVAVMLIGLTAGFSTCMALVGGLLLGASSRFAANHPNATKTERFKPHLMFNIGRIVSYTILGGVIGAIGSVFQLSGFSLGLLTLAVALVMLMLGLQLTGLFPRLTSFSFSLPSGIARAMGIKNQKTGEYSHMQSMFLGAGTFFLPCGFTQAMQLYAMSSGSPIRGAMIMGIFALGTAPGLLSIGGLTSVIKGAFAQKFFKFAGVVVVLLALFSLNNALNLIGWNPIYAFSGAQTNVLGTSTDPNVTREGNVQVVRMTQTSGGYEPNSFTITQGVPVRWVITSQDPNSCAASLVSAKLGVRKILTAGENVIEFTPTETGSIMFSCSMGMYRGSFNVVASGNVQGATTGNTNPSANQVAVVPPNIPAAQPPAGNGGGSCGGSGGGCGCGGGAKKPVVENAAPKAAVQDNVQVIKTTYTNTNDIQPNTFTVKAGVPVRFEINAQDDGSGCMGSIMVSRLTSPQLLEKGKTNTFTFTPSAGEYPITCAMGIPRGKIIVQ